MRQPALASTAAYWSLAPAQLIHDLQTSSDGLQPEEAGKRLQQYGPNTIQKKQEETALRLLIRQFKSPLVLILIFAAIISGIVGEWVDAIIVLIIVLGRTLLGFFQEYTASQQHSKAISVGFRSCINLNNGSPS